jgi:hypothetical protein
VNDKDPNAYEKPVDRLLVSIEYAERQINIWLDVARYADTRGGLNDNERHTRRGDCETRHPDAHCCSIDARAKNQWPAYRGR